MSKPNLSEAVTFQGVNFSLKDVSNVIGSFYKIVSNDEVLSVPFSSVKDWPSHIENLTHFWWIKFGGARYSDATYNPPLKHFQAGFNKDFLDRWLKLFKTALDSNLTAEQADVWEELSISMGKFLLNMNDRMSRSLS